MTENIILYLQPGEHTNWYDLTEPNKILVFTADSKDSRTWSAKSLSLTPSDIDKLVGNSFIKIAQCDNYKEINAYHGTVDGEDSIVWINPKYITSLEPTSKFNKEKISVWVGAIDNYIINNPDYYELFGNLPKHTLQEFNLLYLPCDWIIKHHLLNKCTATMRRRVITFLKLTALLKPLCKTLQERY